VPPAEHVPAGTVHEFKGLSIYVAGAENKSTKCVVVIPEVFGWAGRTKEIADTLATKLGCLVIMPDFMHGQAWSLTNDWATFGTWIGQWNWNHLSNEMFNIAVPFAENLGAVYFGIIGFCWGSWVGVNTCSSTKFRAGVYAHPSHTKLLEILGQNTDEVLTAINCPQLVMNSNGEPPSVLAGGAQEVLLRASGKACAPHHIFRDFPDMEHGWVTRGSLDEASIHRDYFLAMDAAVAFFRAHL